MKIELPFELGELLWKASYGSHGTTITCPECVGTREVTVIMGNGERYKLDCRACATGYDAPTGKVTVFKSESVPEPFIPRRYGHSGESWWYSESEPDANCYSYTEVQHLFRTKEECLADCTARNLETDKENEKRALAQLASKRRDLAWSVHYWRSERKRHMDNVERIDRQLRAIADREKKS
jgi:hypothetical protein